MMGGFGFGAGMLVWVILLGVIVWAVVRATTQSPSGRPTDSAHAILDQRLARGEISIDEYRKLRAEL